MSDFRFAEVGMLHWLWLLPVLTVLMAYAARRRGRALRRFIEAGLLQRVAGHSLPDPSRRVLKAALLLAGVALLVVALSRPGWNAVRDDVPQSGRDVVFLLDVSRSMLAEDLPPNRLERAKLAIRDAVERLRGDRVALAVFAGATVVKCPLTVDYGFFRMALDDVTPATVGRGGSLIGDAVRRVVADVFDAKRTNVRDIVLITDGEDHESFPVEAAAQAGAQGVRLIAIGLGDESSGQRIPAEAAGSAGAAGGRTFLRYQGQEVWSKLDADTLRRMAEATPGGVYVNVATGAVDLGDIYSRLVAQAQGEQFGFRTVERVEEKFQLFLIGCLILLALEIALRDRSSRQAAALACLLALGGAARPADAASARGLVNQGNDSYRAQEYEDALAAYDQALEKEPDSPYASFNRANALYRASSFAEAADAYAASARGGVERGLANVQSAALHGLGNARYREAEAEAESDPGSALRLLESAAEAFADAVRVDARRSDSAHNLELAREMIQNLRERASQQSAGAGEDGESQGPQDRQEKLRQAAEEQDRLAEESRKQQEDRQRRDDAEAQQEQRRREGELARAQDDLRERTQDLSQGSGQEGRQRLEDAVRHQQQAREDLQRGEPREAERAQRAAAEALREAADAEAGEGPSEQLAEADQGEGHAESASGSEGFLEEMTADQILAKERQDRQRRELQRVGVVKVERDW